MKGISEAIVKSMCEAVVISGCEVFTNRSLINSALRNKLSKEIFQMPTSNFDFEK